MPPASLSTFAVMMPGPMIARNARTRRHVSARLEILGSACSAEDAVPGRVSEASGGARAPGA